jgi:hypothetical protein
MRTGVRRMRRGPALSARESGSALIGVMAVVTAALLLGSAIFILGHSEGDLVEYAVDDARAFYVAEGGLERARAWLGDLIVEEPGADPVGMIFESQSLGGGHYEIKVVDNASEVPWLPAYEVVSTGELDGVVRQVRSTFVAETFARYQWFVERGGWTWFITGDRFEGPVHVNQAIQIDGDPWFGGTVSSASNVLTMKDGSCPVFERGYQLNAPGARLPDDAYMESTLKASAMADGGLYAPPIGAKNACYVVELGKPTSGELTYQAVTLKKNGSPKSVGPPRKETISALNGSAWFDETIVISGTIDGQLTICADGDILIYDDILYEASTPGHGPDPGCDDVLGLVALDDIVISYTPANQSDCEVHGVLMALEKNIEAEDYQFHSPRGDFIIYGGLIADYSIHLGQFDNGVCQSGYERDYRYDPRLFTMPPPFFPLTGRYVVYSWEEVVPPEA